MHVCWTKQQLTICHSLRDHLSTENSILPSVLSCYVLFRCLAQALSLTAGTAYTSAVTTVDRSDIDREMLLFGFVNVLDPAASDAISLGRKQSKHGKCDITIYSVVRSTGLMTGASVETYPLYTATPAP